MAAARPAVDGPDARKADLARIHALKRELQLDDDAYRDVMATVCQGVRSAGKLDVTGRQRLIEHLQGCVRRDRGAGRPAAARRTPLSPTGKKLWSLWMQAADKGLVRQRSMSALCAWLERQTGVARIEWLQPAQADLAIESLKRWVARGVEAAR